MKNKCTPKIATSIFCLLLFLSAKTSIAQNQNALDYDGLDDNVITAGASILIGASPQLSLVCWVYATNPNPVFPDFDGFCGFRNDLDADFYMVQIGASTVEARFRNSSGTAYDIVDSTLVLNSWQHYAFIYDGTKTVLYHNGILAGTTVASGNIINQGVSFNIGNIPYFTTNYSLTGKTDEVSLWNKALTAFEVNCIYRNAIDPTDANLRLYYKFNQGINAGNNTSITTLTDASLHMDGTLNNFSLTGASSNFVAGVINSTNIADVICHGQSYTFGSQVLTAGGIYYAFFPTISGCDSAVELTLAESWVDVSTSGGMGSGQLIAIQGSGATYQWVNCDSGYAPITGETLQVFNCNYPGIFAVIVTLNGCTDTSVCINDFPEGIPEKLFSSEIKIFPNPVTDFLAVDFSTDQKNILISVTDISGREILKSEYDEAKNPKLNVSDFSAGVYILTVSSSETIAVFRLMKK